MTSKYFPITKKESTRPGIARKRAVLQRFDPINKAASKKLAAWNDWSFFENTDCFMIDGDIHGRMQPNPMCDNIDFYFLGRQNAAIKPTVIAFSKHQGGNLAKFLGQILDEFAQMQEIQRRENREETPLIPFLRKKRESMLTYPQDKQDRWRMWQKPDLDLGTIKVLVLINSVVGIPQVYLNSPVSEETSKKNHSWCGPVLGFCMSAAANLESFILEHRRGTLDHHILVRPKAVAAMDTLGIDTVDSMKNDTCEGGEENEREYELLEDHF